MVWFVPVGRCATHLQPLFVNKVVIGLELLVRGNSTCSTHMFLFLFLISFDIVII